MPTFAEKDQLSEMRKPSYQMDAMLLGLWLAGELKLSRDDVELLLESLEALLERATAVLEKTRSG